MIPLLAYRAIEVGVLYEVGGSADGILPARADLPKWSTEGRSTAEIVSLVGNWRPDAIYSQGLQDGQVERSLAQRFPTVLYAHNYFGACVSGTKCHTRPHWETCQRTLGLGCLAAYFPRGCGGSNPLTMLRLYRKERRRQSILDRFKAVLVASRHMAEEYRRSGVPGKSLQLVPYFTSTPPDPTPPSPRTRSDGLLFVGRVTALKGWRELLNALPVASTQLGRSLTLTVAGDGPDRGAFEKQAFKQGLRTRFLGWVNPSQREAEMRAADLLVVPSVWPEPFGIVGIEAGCVGLPAVGFATGGIADWLIPGVSGESAPGQMPASEGLAAALVRALKDEAHLQGLRIGAWKMATRFSAENHLNRLIPILQAAAQ